jgi:hypothetical protein
MKMAGFILDQALATKPDEAALDQGWGKCRLCGEQNTRYVAERGANSWQEANCL